MNSKNTPLVSVIVPVYNVEKYLRQCLDSIVNQTLQEIEIILIDDGSTDSSGTICDEYAAMDSRIVLIHKENAGLGAAYNTGLEIAKGEYIGFVESDDWVELNMFEELYNKAREFDVDVVKSLYTNNYIDKSPRIVNKFHNCNYNNTVIVNNFYCPQYYHGHVSHWSAIYKKELIGKNKLNFRETPGASCQDVSFAFLTFIYAKNIFIYTKSFYNYREDSIGSSKTKGYKIALASLNVRQYIRSIIEEKNLSKQYRELEAKKIYQALTNDYYFRTPFNKKTYFLRQISLLFKKYINEIDFYYFNEKEKRIFTSIANDYILFFIKDMTFKKTKNNSEIGIKILAKYFIFYKRKDKGDRLFKIFGITLSSGKTIDNVYTRKILGIPIFKKKFSKNKTIRKYFLFCIEKTTDTCKVKILNSIPLYYKQNIKGDRLFKIFGITLSSGKTIDNVYIRKVLGMPVFIKIVQKASCVKNNTNLTEQDVFRIVANANACKELHLKTFPKYKNINKGKDVYIIATGPSLDYAPITRGIHIACNRAIELNKVYNFNYSFMIDYPNVKDYIDKVRKMNCVIFFGTYMYNNSNIKNRRSIPNYIREDIKSESFYTEVPFAETIYNDIEILPLFDSWTITHPAMHFALFTNPKRIFLIGCDTANNGYFGGKDKPDKINVNKLIDGYKKIKTYQEIFYPNTEIISINPVGLKGLFKDLYTQDFLNKHNISNNNKILYENYIKD
ncbi:glycosyltransferase [Campylobacter lari]|uniref:glycosyltransferase n=1 Tax=Campylobacter lari TaxID=201 RepID=UPI00144D5D98|nr:glycosyltransferase [Campylobacter lari]MBT0759438.1 glycosyltransferase [Campylobacter lari]